MTPKQVERLEKTLGRVAREQGLDQKRLRRWVSFLALCGVLESAVEKGVIDIYYPAIENVMKENSVSRDEAGIILLNKRL